VSSRERSRSRGLEAGGAARRERGRAGGDLPIPLAGVDPAYLDAEPREGEAPPLHGKVCPRTEMGDATPSLDDAARRNPHHPNDGGTTTFAFDPEAADAAADLAGELGATFLEGATRGEDVSDLAMEMEDREVDDVPYLVDHEPDDESKPM
jgi:hypothetical protein